jgi:hypothetical protein
MLPMSVDCPFLIALHFSLTLVFILCLVIGYSRHKMKTSVREKWRAIKNGQSTDTGNIGYTRHRMKTSVGLSILDCPSLFSNACLHPVSCVTNVASVCGLSILDCPSLFSNACLHPVSCVTNVVSVCGLSILDCPSLFSNACLHPVSCVTNVASVCGSCLLAVANFWQSCLTLVALNCMF